MTREEIVKALRVFSGEGEGLKAAAADLIENQAREIDALVKAGRPCWIPVEESLPQPFVSVLGYMPEEAPLPTVHECYYADVRGGEWFSMWCYGAKNVTHWMPMPEAPESEGVE